MAAQSIARGANLEIVVYDGAQHSFDDPGARRQSLYANRQATLDARKRAAKFFAHYLEN